MGKLIEFSCIEMLHTLSKTRSNKIISSDFGISYSQINTWTFAVTSPDSANVSLDYFIYFFLEYFKRINIEESMKLMQKYELSADVDEIFLENMIFPENMIDSYVSSSILWKNELIDFLYTQNCQILECQIKVINEYLSCNYESFLPKKELSSGRLSEFLHFNSPTHL